MVLAIKIYPAPHQVKSTKKPKLLDIPVAHIEKEYHPEEIVIEPSSDFVIPSEEYIAPYQRFKTDTNLFFDSNKELVKLKLRLKNNRYVYEPENSREFSPNTFSFAALIKRRDQYSTAKEYNMRVGIYKQNTAATFAKQIMPLFGNAPYRGTSPSNVTVNSGDTDTDAIIHSDSKDLDFLFINTIDAMYTEDKKTTLDLDSLLDTHCNLWLTVEDTAYSRYFSDDAANANYITQMIKFDTDSDRPSFNNDRPFIVGSEYGFAAISSTEHPSFPRSNNNYVVSTMYMRSPIVIIEKPDKGYIVISHKKMFDEIETYSSYIYNVMVQLYLHSYIETNTVENWITDEPVDYIGSINTPYHRRHPVINISDMVVAKKSDVQKYKLINERLSRDDIMQESLDASQNAYFKKLTTTDPKKSSDSTTSVFSLQNTVVYYDNPQIRLIEDDVQFYTEIDDNEDCYVTIDPFVSSSNRIIVSESKKFKIPDIEKTYHFYVLPINKDNVSEIMMVESTNTSISQSAIFIGAVHVEFEGEPLAYDIRMLGGGLPRTYTDYDMLDIGNLNGRPYRVGTGAVIKIPKRYKEYDVRIKDAVARYKVAADKFYFIYD